MATTEYDLSNLTGVIEDLVIDPGAGNVVKFISSGTFQSVTMRSGSVDLNGQTITSQGAFDIEAGANFFDEADAMNGGAIIIADGDNSSWVGTAGTLLLLGGTNSTATWTITVQAGTLVVQFATVGYADASGGTRVRGKSSDNITPADNINWQFRQSYAANLALLGVG